MRLTMPDSYVRLEIVDDGRGIDPEADLADGHHGLANMRTRAEALEGTFDIQSRPGEGTHIIVSIPRARSQRGASQ
jgi:signal transduction histidine kinase